jgi:predicted metal-dependent enzyme (double-stranded beta helix superfamily)
VSQDPVRGNSKLWPWPDSLDALAAAPAHHQLLLEDEQVRVLHTRIAPGDVVPLHCHRWGGVAYLQSWSHFIRRNEKGEILFDSRHAGDPPKPPCAQRVPPLPPHTVENLGPSEISIVMIEFKDSSGLE